MNYLKQFIIGSSYIVFFPFFYSVKNNQPKKNYKYQDYTLVAPLWFGLWNVISFQLAKYLNLTLKQRFILISIISSLSIMMIATYLNSYNFTKKEWKKYYIYIFIKYMFVWNIIIYNIEKYFI